MAQGYCDQPGCDQVARIFSPAGAALCETCAAVRLLLALDAELRFSTTVLSRQRLSADLAQAAQLEQSYLDLAGGVPIREPTESERRQCNLDFHGWAASWPKATAWDDT